MKRWVSMLAVVVAFSSCPNPTASKPDMGGSSLGGTADLTVTGETMSSNFGVSVD
jgi:hypothetical protein